MVQWSRYAIAYSMDTLIPGLYLWLGPLSFRIGGVAIESIYSADGTIAITASPIGDNFCYPLFCQTRRKQYQKT
ncbi:MAG: hypothetical protein F6K55_11330 [Moorea sp. SIO4A3]|nr:hypothetical protein [Moorena sp. SIO4A3]